MISQLQCSNCISPLDVSKADGGVVTCEFCGGKFVISQAISTSVSRDARLMVALRKAMIEVFSLSDLETICVDISAIIGDGTAVDYENIPGRAKSDKARELIMYLSKREWLHHGIAVMSGYPGFVTNTNIAEILLGGAS